MSLVFQKATKKQARLRMALIGPSGGGKTYTALAVAAGLGDRIAVIDTEHGSASKYADLFDFDVLALSTYAPATYVEAINAAAAAGYDVVVVDSLSHAWTGKDGALEQVDRATAQSRSGNKFTDGWREVTPQHNALIEAIVSAPIHVIATMRAKTEYVIEEDSRGKKVPRKVGLAPVQRAGMEYEFDLVGDIDHSHTLVVSKSRCPDLSDAVIAKPGVELANVLAAWLSDGEEIVPVDRTRLDAALARLAELDDVTDYPAALDKASHKDHGRPLALLTQAEIDGYADRMEKHAAGLEEALNAAGNGTDAAADAAQGSGEGPSGPPMPPADDAAGTTDDASSRRGASSSSSPDTGSEGTSTGTDEGSTGEAPTSAGEPGPSGEPEQETMFAAPTGARGSRSRSKPKDGE